jgi:hypothetical protein
MAIPPVTGGCFRPTRFTQDWGMKGVEPEFFSTLNQKPHYLLKLPRMPSSTPPAMARILARMI